MINAHYVDADNTIVAWETPDGHRASSMASARDVLDYLAAGGKIAPYAPPVVDPKEQARTDLAATDKEMARIAEDLINTLIAKGVIAAQDLPKPAMSKIFDRAALRKALQADGN